MSNLKVIRIRFLINSLSSFNHRVNFTINSRNKFNSNTKFNNKWPTSNPLRFNMKCLLPSNNPRRYSMLNRHLNRCSNIHKAPCIIQIMLCKNSLFCNKCLLITMLSQVINKIIRFNSKISSFNMSNHQIKYEFKNIL